MIFNSHQQGNEPTIFVAVNNLLYQYSAINVASDGHDYVMTHTFDANITGMKQDEDTLLLSMDNDELLVYDWNVDKEVDRKLVSFSAGAPLHIFEVAAKVVSSEQQKQITVVCGSDSGEIEIFTSN